MQLSLKLKSWKDKLLLVKSGNNPILVKKQRGGDSDFLIKNHAKYLTGQNQRKRSVPLTKS